MAEDGYVKVLFQFYSDILDRETVETMWAIIVDENKGLYKMDSIPFYAPKIAVDDIIYAEFDEYQERLTYRYTVEYSGNSTVQVVILGATTPANDIRVIFDALGCSSEKANEGYFTIDVPFDLNYSTIQNKLIELQEAGILDYAEPCLSQKHGME